MCKPGDDLTDLRAEARLLDEREGVGERRMWDAFWKLLSLLVIPWATFVSWGLWQVTSNARATHVIDKDHARRLELLETQMAPDKRFYRWDGEALDERIEELESLHPRNGATRGSGP